MTEGFAKLAAAAQVGTRKAPPARATDLDLGTAGAETERTVLLELGTLGLMRRAGAIGVPATPLPAAAPETRRIADCADALEEALDDAMPSALEWAREAARRGFVAPPAAVSRLVPLVKRQREFEPVLGERGRWLAGVMGVDLTEPEETLSKDDWETLEPKDRARLIETLPDDEAELFQKALGDRRKEVREAAAERLVRLPDSPQAQELQRMALTAVVLHKGLLKSSLEIVPPDPASLPKWLPRDYPTHGLGPAANALRDLLASVPPSIWGESYDRLLDLARRTEYADALRLGWERAVLRHGDQAWIDALFVRSSGERFTYQTQPIVERASEEAFDREVLARLRSPGKGVGAALETIRWRNAPFSAPLSRAIVAAAQTVGASYYLFESLGGRLDLSVWPLLNDPWADGPAEELRLEWRKTLDLRRRLHESLQ